jgi:predicted transcriptional regulator
MVVTGQQVKAARGLLGINQTQLARASGVGLSAVVRCEKSSYRVTVATLDRIVKALERQGVVFDGDAVKRSTMLECA